MLLRRIKVITASATVALAALSTAPLQAAGVADFYKDRTVTIMVGFGAGGSKAANYFYTVAPRNGAVLAHLSNSAALQQVLRPERQFPLTA